MKTTNTTINIPKELRDALQGNRKYKRETYAEIIRRLMIKDKRSLKK